MKVQTKRWLRRGKKQKTENHLNRGNNSKGLNQKLEDKAKTPDLQLTWRDMTRKTLAADKLAKWRHRLSIHKVMGNRWTQSGWGRLIRQGRKLIWIKKDSPLNNKQLCQSLLMKYRPFLQHPHSHQTLFALCQRQLLANTVVPGQVLRSWKQWASAKHTTKK